MRTRRALSAAEALDVREALDGLADAVIGWDVEKRIVHWNRAAQDLYGFTREEALGRRPAELLSTRFPAAPIDAIRIVTDTGRWTGHLVQQTKDGRELTVESRWLARYDEHGRVGSGMSVDRDITARIEDRWEKQLLQASAEHAVLEGRLKNVQRLESVGQIAGAVAHDFNNMLAVIINYSAMVGDELAALVESDPDQERWRSMSADVDEVVHAAERAGRLTHQLLTFSRQTQPNPVPIDLNASVAGVEELLRRTLGSQVELAIDLADELALIRADPGEIEHMIINLAINSRDALPDGGTIAIDTANVEIDAEYALPRPELLPGSYVRLRISDTGTGMTPEVVARAFEPFFTTKPLGEGTGLGLANVLGSVRRVRGRVELQSDPGIGTTVGVLFPVADEPASGQPFSDTSTAAGPADATILVVDDETALLEATRRILDQAGYRVLAARSGADALDAARIHAGQIDVLLTDVAMRGMRGEQLAHELRKIKPSLRVLFMSAFAGSVIRPVTDLTEAELIEKPFTGAQLLERVATLAARPA
ncbi:MAG: response regulator [Solirubrobacteraceae bacterium]